MANKCPYCGNSLFPRQFRCEECGRIQPKEASEEKQTKKKSNKEEK